ncbi:MAG: phosphoribosylformylglycinamidine synthase subunit PurL [Acidimicrobiales bacterium]
METYEFVVGPAHEDAEAVASAALFDLPVEALVRYRLVHLRGDISSAQLTQVATTFCIDPVHGWWEGAETGTRAKPSAGELQIETGLRPGVTDREGAELVRASNDAGIPVEAATVGTRWIVRGELSAEQLQRLSDRVLHNEVIERWANGRLEPSFVGSIAGAPATEVVPVRGLSTEALATLNAQRRLGLDPEEMEVISAHYETLERDPTDAELETLAQTWSEHCAHKTFRAHITVTEADGSTTHVDGLLNTYLRAATDAIGAPWVRSAFVDNAGIVKFDDEFDIALKAETHNHPSALEPFGGANTGVGGVVRDILGVSAKPISVSDVLCFGSEDTPPQSLPDGVLHPRRIRDGVVAGVGDYGNKIGVPNIAGAIIHDPRYVTTPLVFAGCIGLLPSGSNPTNAAAGDNIVVLGGAVGRDGVGGATFSSQTMGAETAEVAGSSVQIGDPIVEKGLIDVVLEARDAKLYTAITDCGAGGLSSAVGEMAEELGARVDLKLVPRKYSGLAPWEVWLSEAQERMVLAVPDPGPLLELAAKWSVDAAVIGAFTGDGVLTVLDGEDPVIEIDCGFLHDGRPKRHMEATVLATTPRSPSDAVADTLDPVGDLLKLLSHPSIRSNEDVVRTFDHEIMGGTVVRPYGGPEGDGPADGTTQVPPGTNSGKAMAIGIGVNALIGDLDSYAMAWHVVDEAVRNVVLGGADPHQLSLLDNFAWGKPTNPEALGQIVAACRGCHDAAMHFKAPFVSGKDSLYNEFVRPDGTPDPVAPTLVITAVGIVDNPATVPLTGVVKPGNDVWLIGPPVGALGGSHYEEIHPEIAHGTAGPVPPPIPVALATHRAVANLIADGVVESGHDLSDGGLAVAAAEWAFAGRTGLLLDDQFLSSDPYVLFGERAARYLLEVAPSNAGALDSVPGARRIGVTTDSDTVVIGEMTVSLADIESAYRGHIQ